MDKIIGFSDDELLVKILSFLPTKDAVRTSILSKQWKFLWMRVPKLDFDEKIMYPGEFFCQYIYLGEDKRRDNFIKLGKSHMMRRFIDRNLPLHSSPVIQSLRLELLTDVFQPEDIKLWVEIAISSFFEELSVAFGGFNGIINAVMPSSLYTCKSLVTLKLNRRILVDVPHVFCLPSLKVLHLRRVIYADEESLQRLLSNSSVLEDLVLELSPCDNVRKFAVIIPSLLSLSFRMSGVCAFKGVRIDTPSLKYFKVQDFCKISFGLIENMHKLEEADITAGHNIKKLLELVTSVKRLSLRVIQDNGAEAITAGYGDDIVFNKLEHLKFQIFDQAYWSKVLYWLLIASPKLRNLEFDEIIPRDGMDTLVCWKQLNSVPQCLLSSLQTFQWAGYNRVSVEGKDLVKYILRKSCQLKTATILFVLGWDPQKKLEMETEVKFCFRASPTCNLLFHSIG